LLSLKELVLLIQMIMQVALGSEVVNWIHTTNRRALDVASTLIVES
jgi:hypothetical protein